MAKRNKYARLNKIIWITIILLAVWGYIDSVQIKGVQDTDEGWSRYEEHVAPMFIKSWLINLIVIAVMYFIFTNDLSEALAVFAVPFILLKAGAQDLAFLIFTGNVTGEYCWFGFAQNTISKLIGETCVTLGSLIANVAIVGVLVWLLFKYLKSRKW